VIALVEFIIMPAIVIGLIVGLYEFLLMSRDVAVPMHKFGHGLQAILFSVLFVFASMNAEWMIETFGFLGGIPFLNTLIGLRILIGVLAALKLHAASAALQGMGSGMSMGMAEKWTHTVVIAGLIIAAPYIYPFIEPVFPEFLK